MSAILRNLNRTRSLLYDALTDFTKISTNAYHEKVINCVMYRCLLSLCGIEKISLKALLNKQRP